jgi:hypothetical protein
MNMTKMAKNSPSTHERIRVYNKNENTFIVIYNAKKIKLIEYTNKGIIKTTVQV